MRSVGIAFRDRRLWAGLALGGALAAVALVWSRAPHEGEASARDSQPVASKPIAAPAPPPAPAAGKIEPAAAAEIRFARYEDYFDRNYYATYSLASPPVAAADWGRGTSRGAPSAPQSAFTLPSVGELLEPAKLLPPKVPLSLPSAAALPDVSRLAPAATVSVSAPSSSIGLLTNNTPFHLFVTSDPVSAASSTASGAPSVAASAGGLSSGGGAAGAVTGTAGSVAATAGSLLHK
jgi:hypothetical protein